MLEKLDKLNCRLSSFFESMAFIGLLMMMVITCIDVVGAKVFFWRLFGAIDIVMLSQIVAIAFAASMALILGRHIQVEFIVSRLPRQAQAVINSIISLFGFGLFCVIIWRLFVLGYSFQTSGEYSATAKIPYYPFAYGIAIASIPVCFALFLQFVNSLKKMVQK